MQRISVPLGIPSNRRGVLEAIRKFTRPVKRSSSAAGIAGRRRGLARTRQNRRDAAEERCRRRGLPLPESGPAHYSPGKRKRAENAERKWFNEFLRSDGCVTHLLALVESLQTDGAVTELREVLLLDLPGKVRQAARLALVALCGVEMLAEIVSWLPDAKGAELSSYFVAACALPSGPEAVCSLLDSGELSARKSRRIITAFKACPEARRGRLLLTIERIAANPRGCEKTRRAAVQAAPCLSRSPRMARLLISVVLDENSGSGIVKDAVQGLSEMGTPAVGMLLFAAVEQNAPKKILARICKLIVSLPEQPAQIPKLSRNIRGCAVERLEAALERLAVNARLPLYEGAGAADVALAITKCRAWKKPSELSRLLHALAA